MDWIKRLLSDDPSASTKRVGMVVVLLAFLVCLGVAVIAIRPMVDIPVGWVSLLLGIYGIGVTGNVIEKRINN